MREHLEERYRIPMEHVYTGWEPVAAAAAMPRDRARLEIVYTGYLYGEKRDVGPVLDALERLGDDADRCRLVLAGPDVALVTTRAASLIQRGIVEIRGNVSRAESLELQQSADVLLLLMWNVTAERMTIPGKLFEYMALLKPVLLVGSPEGSEAAEVAIAAGCGFVAHDSVSVAKALAKWLEEKRSRGLLSCPRGPGWSGLSSASQAQRLGEFLGERIKERSGFSGGHVKGEKGDSHRSAGYSPKEGT